MKTIVNEINGRKDFPIFEGTDEQVVEWVKNNSDEFNLNEEHSCKVLFEKEDRTITISGDEDLEIYRILDVSTIKLEEAISKSSIVLDNLSEEKQALINKAVDEITIEKLNSLDYGEEMELVDGVTLSHYCEDEIVVVNLTEEWTEVLQVQWDTDSGEIVYEAL